MKIAEFEGCIIKAINLFSVEDSTHKVQVKQYEMYNNELYKTKEEIITYLLENNIDKEKIKKMSSAIYTYCPSKEDASEILELTQEFVLTINKLCLVKDISEFKKEILETFTGVWRMIATYMFFDTLTRYDKYKEDRKKTKECYFDEFLFNRISVAKEIISNLNSIYLNNLDKIKEVSNLPNTPETELIRDIFFDMGMEGVKEDDKSIS